ncbi:MAG: YneF family protein [Mycoplasmatota bacterium]|nr:YneF family protein [Mycoplasmatota bacterium]
MNIMLHDILLVVVGLLIGAVSGFFIARTVMQKYLKKNPPINEDMIKALMMQMGRKPNQKQINQMMKAMEKYQ